MADRTAASFVESWKKLDGQFDEVARLRELRTLVAQGAVSQDVYDQLHRYTLEKQASGSGSGRKQLERKRAQNKKLPSQNRVHGRPGPNGNRNGLARDRAVGSGSAARAPQMPARPAKELKGRTLPRPPSLLKALTPGGRAAAAAAAATTTAVADFDGVADWGAKPVMEGFLFKRAITSGRNWKKRYVRLFYDRLEYFANKGDRTPRGEIRITKDFYVADSILRRIKNGRAHGFMVSDFAQTYYLAAASAESKVYWMHTVRRVIQRLKDQDEQTDAPVLLDRPPRTKSETEREMQERMDSYRRSQTAAPVTAVAARASQRVAAQRVAAQRVAAGQSASTAGARRSSRGGKRGSSRAALLQPHESLASSGDVSLSDREYDMPLHEEASDEEEEEEEPLQQQPSDDDAESDDDDEDLRDDRVRAVSFSPNRAAVVSGASGLSGARSARFRVSDRDERARTLTSAAMAAHVSARMSAKTNLGLDVVPYAEQEEMRDEAAAADAARFMADLENEAALAEVDTVLEAERELRAELRAAVKSGTAQSPDMEAVRAEIAATRARLAELEGVLARSAAERAEAEETAQRSRDRIARATAANAVVLELAKVDEAILRAELMAERAEEARRRAEAAAMTVHREALAEEAERTAELAQARKQADAAAALEEERAAQEARILAKLEETAAAKVSERQARKVQEMADRAAEARAEAEEQHFQAELEATRLAAEKLDAAQKAAAVTRALRETQAIIDKSRARSGLTEFGFAQPKSPATAAPGQAPGGAAQRGPPSQKKAAAATQRRASLFDKLRPRRSLDAKAKAKDPKNSKNKKQPPQQPPPQQQPAPMSPSQPPGEPEEATSAFQSFFTAFTQAAMGGLEYVTGLQLTGDEEYAAQRRAREAAGGDRASTTLTYDDDADDELDDDDDSDGAASDADDDFDRQLRAVGEAERIKAASAWIDFEIRRLLEVIREIGRADEYGRSVTTFRELLDVYEDISDTLVGILLRAKRAGKVFYEGDMLFEIEHDDVEIVALE